MLTIMQRLMEGWGTSSLERELFISGVVYSFIFSLIITSGLSMILSRYISDKLFCGQEEHINPSMKGALIVSISFAGIAGFIFYLYSGLDFKFCLFAYILFIQLITLWIQMVYVSALKEYTKLIKGFLYGILTGIFFIFILLKYYENSATSALISLDLCFFIMIIYFSKSILDCFPNNTYRTNFSFFKYFDKYPSLFFINTFYIFGLYSHNFIIWMSGYGVVAGNTYVFAPVYDIPVFWAFLSVIPTMVVYVVSFETSFYEKYHIFYKTICTNGTFEEIANSKKDMTKVLKENFKKVMNIQAIFSILFIICGTILLPMLGLEESSIVIFRVLVLGYYAFIMMYICISVLLYFDDRKGALIVSVVFLTLNILLTVINVIIDRYLGAGFSLASYISLSAGILRIRTLLKNINYYTFCSQSILGRDKKFIFTWFAERTERVPKKRCNFY